MNDERPTRVPWVVMGLLALAFLIGGIATGGKEKPKKPPPPKEAARLLFVPPADGPRTVVVPPCDAPVDATVRNVEAGEPTPNATRLELPRGDEGRSVLVPHCLAGGASAGGRAPSAAFVLPAEAHDAAAKLVQERIAISNGSPAKTIVVPRCVREPAQRDVVVGSGEGDPDVAVAPSC